MTPDEYLHDVWRELRNCAAPPRIDCAVAAARALHAVRLISDDQCELWTRRFNTCPGHGDEGGRSWCAYCGPLASDGS